ncbi:hypothetical protein DTO96_102392 [Ephemeroptericola cinctiostellae]|uniref:Phage tail protein X n=1 Tax=Ephemeroptericola cinctiostellae TaxID=2268024 RepID=A0A345DE49_9BURK|nr:tail protein X [Ephemeroptericola cinctiostellae]AXF86637.1 hypothetical protein DTO96_102392 [Ephemeroptericola cinctiostellae]
MAYTYRTKEGDVLDVLCAKVYRRDDMIEAVVLANPHVLDYPAILPRGIDLVFPDAPVATAVSPSSVARGGLWGDV